MIGKCNSKLAHRLSSPVLGGACDIIYWPKSNPRRHWKFLGFPGMQTKIGVHFRGLLVYNLGIYFK